MGTLTTTNGNVDITGTLTNTGTLTVGADGSAWNIGEGGVIVGGEVSVVSGAQLTATASASFANNPTFTGVTLAGTLALNYNNVTVTVNQGLTLDGGTVQFNNSQDGLTLVGSGTQTLGTVTGTTGQVNFASGSNDGIASSSGPLLVGSGITVSDTGGSGTVGSGTVGSGTVGSSSEPLTLDGSVVAGGNGATITVTGSSVTNNGTVEAVSGGTLTVNPTMLTNFSSGTLTGGTWEAMSGGALRLIGDTITTNTATILIDGASSQIDSDTGTTNALSSLSANAAGGNFTIQNGANLATTQALGNAGTVTIGANSTLTVGGSYSQSSAGTLIVEIGGTTAGTFAQLAVAGSAALAGTLTATLVNGFNPGPGETIPIITYGSTSGSFTTFNSPTNNGGPLFTTQTEPTVLNLLSVSVPAAPTNFRVTAVTATSISFSWTANDPSATSYEVWLSTNFAPVAGSPFGPGTDSATVTGLTSDTTYRFQVRADNAAGGSAWLQSGNIQTLALAPVTIAPGDVTGLIEAIDAADQITNEPNVIDLAPGSTYVLSAPDNYWYGPNGLPPIASNITLNGNINPDGSSSTSGAVIERAPGAVPFRIFYVSGGYDTLPAGQLTLNNLTIEGGLAQGGNGGAGGGGGGAGLGGAIFNQGALHLVGVTFTENTAQGGNGGAGPIELYGSGGGGGGLGGDGGSGVLTTLLAGGGGGGGFTSAGAAGTASFGAAGGNGVQGDEGAGNGAVSSFGGDGGAANTDGFADGGSGGGFGTTDTNFGSYAGAGKGGFGSGSGDGGDGGGFTESGDAGGGGGAFGGGGGGGLDGSGGGGGIGGGGGGGSVYFTEPGAIEAAAGGGGGFGGGGGGLAGAGGFGGGGGGGPVIGGIPDAGFGAGAGSQSGGGGGGGGGAGLGGAVFNMFGTLNVTNSTLAVNTAQGGMASSGGTGGNGFGGAVFNLDGAVTLINDTLAGNHVGGGTDNSGDANDLYNLAFGNNLTTGGPLSANVSLTNDILAGASPAGTSGSNDLVYDQESAQDSGIITAKGLNLIQDGDNPLLSGPNYINANPMLGPLQNNGGPTPTMEVLAGSPLLLPAYSGVLPSSDPTSFGYGVPSSDQRGVSRGNTTNIIGAYQATTATQFGVTGFPDGLNSQLASAGTAYPFTVTAEDPFGKTVYDYAGTVSVQSTDPAASFLLSSQTITAADGGVATFEGTLATPGVQAITAEGGTITGDEAPIVVIAAVPATQLAYPTAAQTAASGDIAPPPAVTTGQAFGFEVYAEGANDSVVTSGSSTVIATITGPQFPSGESIPEPVTGGKASFSGLLFSQTGTYTLSLADAENGGLTPPAPVTITVGLPSDMIPAKLVIVGADSLNSPINSSAQTALVVEVENAEGDPIPNLYQVQFTAPTSGASATFPTAVVPAGAGGEAAALPTANGVQGMDYTVTASLANAPPGVTVPTAHFMMSNTAVPKSITFIGAVNPLAPAGTDFVSPEVEVLDTNGNPVGGVTVTFALPPMLSGVAGATANGSLAVTTGALGSASFGKATAPTLVANMYSGTWTLNASVSDIPSPATLTMTNGPAPIKTLAVLDSSGQPQTLESSLNTVVGTAFVTPLIVQVVNTFGNGVNGIPVKFSVSPAADGASATLSNTTVTSASMLLNGKVVVGVAEVTATANLVANPFSAYTVTASYGPLQTPFGLGNSPGPFAKLVYVSDSPPTAVGTAFPDPLIVEAEDQYGNGIYSNLPTVTFTAPSKGASATFTANNFVENQPGQIDVTATANDIASAISGYTVSASATLPSGKTITASPSPGFSLFNTPGTPTIKSIQFSSPEVGPGQAFGSLAATIDDPYGNLVPDARVTFTVNAANGVFYASFSGGTETQTVTTNTQGVAKAPTLTAATFTKKHASGAFSFTVSASIGASTATYNLQEIINDPAVSPPQSATVGRPYVKALDAVVTNPDHMPVAGVPVTFTAPATGPSGTFNGARCVTVRTNADGIATAPAFTANTQAGSFQVTVATQGVPNLDFISLTNLAGPPAKLAIASGQGEQAAANTAFAVPLAVYVTDAFGNPIAGAPLTFTVQPNPTIGAAAVFGSVTALAVRTDASGLASAPTLAANSKRGSFRVTVSIASGAAQATIDLTIV